MLKKIIIAIFIILLNQGYSSATTCPPGTTVDPTTKQCVCPTGYSYDSTAMQCKPNASSSCPSGYTYNTSINKCATNPVCSSGGSFNPSTYKCEIAPTGTTQSCPTDYTYNSTAKICQGNSATVTCPSGSSYDSINHMCYLPVTCSNATDIPTYTCPSGMTLSSDKTSCVSPPGCAIGTYDSSTNKCVIQPIQPGSCPASNMTYSLDTGLCSGDAGCFQGTYDSSTNQCKTLPSVICQPAPSTSSPDALGIGVSGMACIVDLNGNGNFDQGEAAKCNVIPPDNTQTFTPPKGPYGHPLSTYDDFRTADAVCNYLHQGSTSVSYTCGFNSTCDYRHNGNWGTGSCSGQNYCTNGGISSITCKWNVSNTSSYLCPLDAVACTDTNSAPICPSGGTLNTTTDKCESTNTNLSCPTGYTYDSTLDKCLTNPTCPNGGSLNTTTDKCEIVISTASCPSGYTYNSSIQACTKPVSCLNGGIYNPTTDKCESAITYNCPSGYSYNSLSGKCEYSPPTCPTGTTYNTSTNRCEKAASASCPAGYSYNTTLGKCVVSASCPSGSNLNNSTDKCETAITKSCPSGFTYNSTLQVCQKSPSCSSGTSYNPALNVCVVSSTPVCPSGNSYDATNKVCYVSATCPGGTLNTSTDKCESTPGNSCPSGYSYNSSIGLCVQSPTCPSGSSYDSSVKKCVKTVIKSCPSGYTLNGSTCQKIPTCPSGMNYNTSTNRCEAIPHTTYDRVKAPAGYSTVNIPSNSNTLSMQTTISGYIRLVTSSSTGAWVSLVSGNGGSSSVSFNEYDGTRITLTLKVIMGGSYGPYLQLILSYPGSSNDPYRSTHTSYIPLSKTYYNGCDSVYTNGGIPYQPSFSLCTYSDLGNGQINSGIWLNGKYTTWGSTFTNHYSYGNTIGLSILPTFSCTVGTLSGSLCIANPTCPSGGSLNTTTDKCEITPTLSCASGFTYDSAISACVANPSCPSGYSFNSSLNECTTSPTPVCPSGYSYNSSNGKCEYSPPTCPTGETYNSTRNRCEKVATYSCPSGTTYNSSNGLCQTNAICSYGSLNGSTDKCEIGYTPSCPSGFTYNSTLQVCQASPTCPSGGSYNTSLNECSTANSWICPSGMNLTGSTCYESASCPGGTLNTTTDKCEAPVTYICPANYTYNSSLNVCQSSPVCSFGSFNSVRNECELSAATLCPANYAFNTSTNKCEYSPPDCPTGSTYSTTVNQCAADATHNCPTGYAYSNLTRLCESTPICQSGAYNPVTNSCYAGKNTCPYGSQYPCYDVNGTNMCSKSTCFDASNSSQAGATVINADDRTYQNDGKHDASGNCLGQVYIFNGQGMQCLINALSNCCHTPSALKHQGASPVIGAMTGGMAGYSIGGAITTGVTVTSVGIAGNPAMYVFSDAALPGLAIGIGVGLVVEALSKCYKSDYITDVARDEKLCHYVGEYCSYKFIVCLHHKKSYCCFHSVLARIVQEQGRKQLKDFNYSGDWGDPKSPNCRGFTPEEFEMIDFDKIDLSEWIGDLTQAIQGKAAQIQQNVAKTVITKTSNFIQSTIGNSVQSNMQSTVPPAP